MEREMNGHHGKKWSDRGGRVCVVDLFCGMGGFSCGAVMAGAEVVLAIDSWSAALEVHRLNHPNSGHIKMELGGDNLRSVAALIKRHIPSGRRWHLHGSPPCQLLSVANRNTSNASKGMYLVRWYLDLVRLCQPDSWSMEQVPAARKYLDCRQFEFCEIINAMDYGIPQTRKRLYVGNGWNIPAKRQPASLLSALPHLVHEGTHIRGYTNTRSQHDQNGRHIGNRKVQGMEGFKPISQPTFTVCANGPRNLQLYKLNQTKRTIQYVRDLTVQEHLVIQSFPPKYKFPNHMTNRIRHKLIGNSLCPFLAFLIISHIRKPPSFSSTYSPGFTRNPINLKSR
jgi:DNA (cytosine-5)-methyltransferase 1